METNYRFKVVPCEYHAGYCPVLCETLESAIDELEFWDEKTDFTWAVEGLDERAEQELSAYWDEYAESNLED